MTYSEDECGEISEEFKRKQKNETTQAVDSHSEIIQECEGVLQINSDIEDAIEEGYMGMECTLERGFSLNQSEIEKQMTQDQDNPLESYREVKFPNKYYESLKHFLPYRRSSRNAETIKIDEAGIFSFITVEWITSIMWKAYKYGVNSSDMPKCSQFDSCSVNAQRLNHFWEEEVKRVGLENATLNRPLWKFVRTRICVSIFFLIVNSVVGFISPTIFMRYLIDWLSTDEPISNGVLWSSLVVTCEACKIITLNVMMCINYRTAVRLRAACMGLVYLKLMKVSSLGSKSIGEIINLCANDSQRIFDFVSLGTLILIGPLMIFGGMVYVMWILGPWALFGMTSFILLFPFQMVMLRLNGYLRRRTISITDQRVRLMSEILNYVKFIKMYCWEKCFVDSITDIRNLERKFLERSAYVQSFNLMITAAFPVLAAMMIFLAHVGGGNNLTPAQAFPVVAFLMGSLRRSLNMTRVAIRTVADYKETEKRIRGVLRLAEVDNLRNIGDDLEDFAITVDDATFTYSAGAKPFQMDEKSRCCCCWSKSNDEPDVISACIKLTADEDPEDHVLMDLNFKVKKRELIGICGQFGSGKSSILLGLMGQLSQLKGSVKLASDCAYVSQEPWVINGTVRDNILMGDYFDSKRYYKTIHACCLSDDISLMPDGDKTEVGEKGIKLSGGQKQRLALSRALYSNRDIYLLDDCLSAVDAQVGEHIFQYVFKGILKFKTVVFVTHQLQYLPACDRVLYVSEGRIMEEGLHHDMLDKGAGYSQLFQTHLNVLDEGRKESSSPMLKQDYLSLSTRSRQSSACSESFQLSSKSEKVPSSAAVKFESGAVPSSVYREYVSLAGGYAAAALVIWTFALNAVFAGFSSWWLSYWLNAGSGNFSAAHIGNESAVDRDLLKHDQNIALNPDLYFYKLIYALTVVFILCSTIVRGFVYTKATLRASSRLHIALFRSIVWSPMSFFDSTPSGNIMNLFSRDLDEVDVRLPERVEGFLQNLGLILISLLFVCLAFPIFAVFLIFLTMSFLGIRHIFTHGVRELKRIENESRSPIFTHLNTTLTGLSSIQAYRKQLLFTKRFMKMYDENTCSFFLFNSAIRWLGIRLDLLAWMVTSITVAMCIYLRGSVSTAYAGLALAYSTQLIGLFQYTVRISTETEANFTAVQRILTYVKTLKPEAVVPNKASQSKPQWPMQGRVVFKKVDLKYSAEGLLALDGIDFSVNAGEHVGVVGRTGSGKSSLGAALFRLVELSRGSILIDAVDIGSIGLTDLRSRLSIVPQDPVLFIGSVRFNLDPFGLHPDQKIWDVLEKASMKEVISKLELGLGSPVVEGGSNFSAGERQLLCMARAILRNCKVVFIDEATSGIDSETDAKIQKTLTESFKNCTRITVAHRLNTIMQCDRVMVLDGGSILEYDSPEKLSNDSSSRFSKLLTASRKDF